MKTLCMSIARVGKYLIVILNLSSNMKSFITFVTIVTWWWTLETHGQRYIKFKIISMHILLKNYKHWVKNLLVQRPRVSSSRFDLPKVGRTWDGAYVGNRLSLCMRVYIVYTRGVKLLSTQFSDGPENDCIIGICADSRNTVHISRWSE